MPEALSQQVAIERIKAFLNQHGVRLAAAAVVLAALYLLARASPGAGAWSLLLWGPILAGAAVPLLSLPSCSDPVNDWRSYFVDGMAKARQKEGKYSRYFLRPLHAGSLLLWNRSEFIRDEHIRAGVRVAGICYFWGVMIFGLILVAYVIIAVVVLMIVLAIVAWFMEHSDSGTRTYKRSSSSPRPPIPVKGVLQKGTNWLNEQRAGRVDDKGNIYEGSNIFTERKVGRVDEDGRIYQGTNVLNEGRVGRMDESGNVHSGSNVLNEKKVGRVTEDGSVYEGTNVLNERKVGRVTGD